MTLLKLWAFACQALVISILPNCHESQFFFKNLCIQWIISLNIWFVLKWLTLFDFITFCKLHHFTEKIGVFLVKAFD